jgi:tRNA A37 threonylcarbamoyladenosine modification protein TsaB
LIDVLVISISNPILVGIYKNKKLIMAYEDDGKTSDVLPIIFDKILKEYEISTLYYVNSPGSYMSIKVSYVFLKSLSIVKNLKLKATVGFHFNENSPIKALGKKYFFHENNKTKIDFLNGHEIKEFQLPQNLDDDIFENDSLPKYNLPAV